MRAFVCCVSVLLAGQAGWAQSARTTYVSLGGSANAILVEPTTPGPKTHIAILYTYPATSLALNVPSRSNFEHPSGPQLAGRGYRVLLLNHYTNRVGYEAIAPAIARGVKYLRGVPGVDRVILLGHSASGPLLAFYQNVAENGPRACRGPEKIYPCRGELEDLARADGLVLLDSHLGEAFRALTYLDPAVSDEARPSQRNAALDMFAATNGYDRAKKSATYDPTFPKAFFAAQGARLRKLTAAAAARLKVIEQGQGKYKDDEALEVPEVCCARPLQADVRLVSHSRAPHPLLKADGTISTQIVRSLRSAAPQDGGQGTYEQFSVRGFLAGEAIRTTADYTMSEDAITGIDWASSATSAPSNVEGISVPLLILAMSCHYFIVPDEIIFDHAASRDKQLAYVEGASHGFTPCRPEYGDTMTRTFDYVDGWLSDTTRFPVH